MGQRTTDVTVVDSSDSKTLFLRLPEIYLQIELFLVQSCWFFSVSDSLGKMILRYRCREVIGIDVQQRLRTFNLFRCIVKLMSSSIYAC